jgi:hypothetical protein
VRFGFEGELNQPPCVAETPGPSIDACVGSFPSAPAGSASTINVRTARAVRIIAPFVAARCLHRPTALRFRITLIRFSLFPL